jgi:hypothetical protein
VVNGDDSIEKYVVELSIAIQEALAASAPKRRPRADPPPFPPELGMTGTVFMSHLSRLPSRMESKEKLALLKANIEELPQNILRQMEEEIIDEMRKAAANASANAQRSDQRPRSAREETPVSEQKLKPKRQAQSH